MSLRSESSGKASGFAVSAVLVKRSPSSVFGTSLRGRGPQSFSAVRSLEQARWSAVAAVRQGISLGNKRPSASFKAARGAVALSASPDSLSANWLHQLRPASSSEIGRFGEPVAASRPAALVLRVRECASSASSFARSGRHGFQYAYARPSSVPNKLLHATREDALA